MQKFFFSLLTVLAISAYGQQAVDDSITTIKGKEIIVTGYPVDENRAPLPLSKVNAKEIENAGEFMDVPNIIAQLPSVVSWSQSGLSIGYSFANIRGFDQRRQSILINGVPQNDPEDHSVYWVDMPDLAASSSSIEMQRGAGSAFYGPASIGGSIDVKTMLKPDPNVVLTYGRGTYETEKFALSGNSGLIDEKYMIYGYLSQTKSDGYRNHAFIDFLSYHFSAAGYFEDFSLQLNFYGGPIKDGLDYYGIYPDDSLRSNFSDREKRRVNWSESFLYERRFEEKEEFFQPHYELLSTLDITNNMKLSNTLFYIQGDGYFDFDGTWVNAFTGYRHSEYYRLLPVYGDRYGFTGTTDDTLGNELTHAVVKNKQFGWLPRFEWKHGDDGSLSFGGEVRIHRSLHWGQLLSATLLPTDLPADYHFYEYRGAKNIFSVYVSEAFDLTEKVNLIASAQFVSQKYRFYDEKPFYVTTGLDTGWTNYEFEVPFTFFNPRIGVNVQLNDALRTYASFSYTQREPRLKDYYNPDFFSEPNFYRTPRATYDFTRPRIRPETLLDYELGLVYNRKLSGEVGFKAHLGGYYMPFTDELLKTGETDKFGSSIVANAESVVHYGAEFSTEISYKDLFAFTGNVTASRNEIRKFTLYSSVRPDSLVGKTPIGFPPVVANMRFVIRPIEELSLFIDGRYQGMLYGDLQNSETYRNEPYFVVNTGAAVSLDEIFSQGHCTLKLQVNNLFDHLYTSYVESGLGFFVAAPRHVFGSIEIGI